jgi:hypothetical protein
MGWDGMGWHGMAWDWMMLLACLLPSGEASWLSSNRTEPMQCDGIRPNKTNSKERRLELIRDDWGSQQRALVRAGASAGAGGGGGGGGGGGQKKAIDLLAPLGPTTAPAGGAGAGAGGQAGRKGAGGAVVRRLDEAGLRTALFRLFEERGVWRLKELVARTGQPEADLKAVLRSIAESQATGGACALCGGWGGKWGVCGVCVCWGDVCVCVCVCVLGGEGIVRLGFG